MLKKWDAGTGTWGDTAPLLQEDQFYWIDQNEPAEKYRIEGPKLLGMARGGWYDNADEDKGFDDYPIGLTRQSDLTIKLDVTHDWPAESFMSGSDDFYLQLFKYDGAEWQSLETAFIKDPARNVPEANLKFDDLDPGWYDARVGQVSRDNGTRDPTDHSGMVYNMSIESQTDLGASITSETDIHAFVPSEMDILI